MMNIGVMEVDQSLMHHTSLNTIEGLNKACFCRAPVGGFAPVVVVP